MQVAIWQARANDCCPSTAKRAQSISFYSRSWWCRYLTISIITYASHFFLLAWCITFSIFSGPSTVLPRCALPKYLTEELQKHIPNAIFASNPCRLTLHLSRIAWDISMKYTFMPFLVVMETDCFWGFLQHHTCLAIGSNFIRKKLYFSARTWCIECAVLV